LPLIKPAVGAPRKWPQPRGQ